MIRVIASDMDGTLLNNNHVFSEKTVESLKRACEKKNIKLILPEKRYCTDNAAMIGAEGYLQYKIKNFADLTLNASAVVPLIKEKK